MKKILFAVILSVLTLCIYSQDNLVYKIEKYKGEQRVQCEKPKNKFIQIEEKRGYVIVDDSKLFSFVEKFSDSSCYYCKSSYIAKSGNVYYYLYIFDDQIIISRADEDCDEFVVYYYRKFKPSLIY